MMKGVGNQTRQEIIRFISKLREKFPNVDGVTATPHDKGCGCTDGTNIDLVLNTVAQYVSHPNVGAAVILEPGHPAPTLPELQEVLAAEGLAKYSWPEAIEVFDEFPRTPSLKVVKHDVVTAIVARAGAASPA